MKFLCVVVVALSVGLAQGAVLKQGKKQVLRVQSVQDKEVQKGIADQLDVLQTQYNVDFWLEPRIVGPTDFMVTDKNRQLVLEYLAERGIEYEVMMEDVDGEIDQQEVRRLRSNTRQGGMNWIQYHNVQTIQTWVDAIAAAHPNVSHVESIGRSTEGRDLRLIKIGRPRPDGRQKPAIWLDAGIHAREWISPAIATWFINELLTNATNADIVDDVDWYIIPTTNVDGYEYSQTIGNRLWRKTRSRTPNPECPGVDPNRNFDVQFGGPGTSTNPCSEIYKGELAFSEPETQAMRNFIYDKKAEGVDWQVYVALHSYAQMWLTPWGWTNDLPETYPEMRALGDLSVRALTAVHGTQYRVGSVTELLNPGAGGSDDWAYGSGLFRYSQTVEVRDTGRYGFVLPPEQIIPTGQETWAAFQAMSRFIAEQAKKDSKDKFAMF